MSLKNAATLAFVGMLLLTILAVADCIKTAMAVSNGLVPTVALLRSFVYVIASLTLTIFFCVFSRKQSG